MERLTESRKVIDILEKMNFFQGQRAGRELWFDKPFEVQEQDLNNFNRDIRTISDYIEKSIKLPCKIGDKVYSPTRNFVSEYTIESIEVYKEGYFFNWHCDDGIYINVCGFPEQQIGKTVFLTKEEAEAKLKELENE